jgi:GNAT superfamily N-acetyltransferase
MTCQGRWHHGTMAENQTHAIRPYRDDDLAAVYGICVRTADAGADARGQYRSDDLMPDLFAGPYLFLCPELAFVLADSQPQASQPRHDSEPRGPVGYVIGTADTAAFARAYRERWIPRLAGRYPVPAEPPVSPDDQMLALHYRPERLLWAGLREFPAHLHIDLLPGVQRAGFGRKLMETFYAAAARAGAGGVHVCVVAKNVQAIGFYRHLGFELAEVDEPGGVVYLGRRL